MRRCFAQTYVTRDDGVEYQVTEVTLHLFVYLVTQTQTVVEHRQEEALNAQLRVEFGLDDLDGVEQFSDTLQREELTLYGDDDAVACCERIDGDESQGRTAVDQDIIVLVAYLIEDVLE